MNGGFWAWVIGAALFVALGWVVIVSSRRRAQLERVLADTKARLEHLQRQFERFVPSDVVEHLTEQRGEFAAQRRPVTMLFADLRGFTALSDSLDPAVTVTLLNGYFARMNEAIVRHHGHVSDLIGDGLLALFGALEPNPWQARDAVLAALDMRAALAAYNAELRGRGLPALRFGVGIHGGEVVVGVIGAGQLNKFSVTGDPINVASRVEGLTRDHGVDLLITEEIRASLDRRFRLRAMPAVAVRGKSAPITTYFVEGLAETQAEPGTPPS
ncbi:MAG: adenylate/guanylate cyclase domain-containing protein [Alphaproteobacteria bacterium]|nr:adenylate/guanylate cyclase domain-containing protein [Alphaproteobacteria bacterium]